MFILLIDHESCTMDSWFAASLVQKNKTKKILPKRVVKHLVVTVIHLGYSVKLNGNKIAKSKQSEFVSLSIYSLKSCCSLSLS